MSTRFEHVLPALSRLADNSQATTLHHVGLDMCLSPMRAQRVFTRIVGESPKQLFQPI